MHNHPQTEEEYLMSLNEEELADYFLEMYGADKALGKAIIRCESGFKRTVSNPGSSASGYWQFINGTWRSTMIRMGLPADTDKHDPIISMKAGAWLLATDGVSHWLESRPCWVKYYV